MTRFGHSQTALVEVPKEKITQVAGFLRFEENLRMDWLEMMSAFEKGEKIYLNYFLRSESNRTTRVLRTSVPSKQIHDVPQIQSVTEIWRMALPFEVEIESQFGIHFTGLPKNKGMIDRGIDRSEPPLRKQYVWESELLS